MHKRVEFVHQRVDLIHKCATPFVHSRENGVVKILQKLPGKHLDSFDHIGKFLFHSLIWTLVIALLNMARYGAAVFRLNRRLKTSGFTEGSFTITLNPYGFNVLSPSGEAKFWRWESVRTADSGGGYVFILLFHRALYVMTVTPLHPAVAFPGDRSYR